jgi:hypothetical protein
MKPFRRLGQFYPMTGDGKLSLRRTPQLMPGRWPSIACCRAVAGDREAATAVFRIALAG